MTDNTQTRPRWKPKDEKSLALFGLTPGKITLIPLELPTVILGRQPQHPAGITIDDPRLSRQNTEISRIDTGDYIIADLQSKNGTWVNGVAAAGQTLALGDVVRAGDTVFVIGELHAPVFRADALLIGQSKAMIDAQQTIDRAALTVMSVLIRGETGAGKEVAAAAIHRASERQGRLVAVNCAAIPEQLVERELFGHTRGAFTGAQQSGEGFIAAADGGTLFLDEIGDLPLAAQAKLLRFLETKKLTPLGSTHERAVDVRVIAATHQAVEQMIGEGRFREDLYGRLEEVVLTLPALRQRREDLPLLIAHFCLAEGVTLPAFSADALEALALYHWPRNVRELRKLVTRLGHFAGDHARIELDDLPQTMLAPFVARAKGESDLDEGSTPTRHQLELWLTEHRGNVSAMATALQRERKSVYRWLKRYDLDPKQFR